MAHLAAIKSGSCGRHAAPHAAARCGRKLAGAAWRKAATLSDRKMWRKHRLTAALLHSLRLLRGCLPSRSHRHSRCYAKSTATSARSQKSIATTCSACTCYRRTCAPLICAHNLRLPLCCAAVALFACRTLRISLALFLRRSPHAATHRAIWQRHLRVKVGVCYQAIGSWRQGGRCCGINVKNAARGFCAAHCWRHRWRCFNRCGWFAARQRVAST